MNLTRIVGCVCFTALIACTGGGVDSTDTTPDERTSVSGEVRITPTGEENLAYITVALPTGTCQAGGACTTPLARNPVITLDGAAWSFGNEKRVLKGAHVIGVDGVEVKVTLASREKRTVTLAVSHRKCVPDALPSVASTDFGLTPIVKNADCPSTLSSATATVDPFANNGTMSWYYSGTVGTCSNVFFEGYALANFPPSCSQWSQYVIVGAKTSAWQTCSPVQAINAAQLCNEVKARDFHNFAFLGGVALGESNLAYAPVEMSYVVNGVTKTVKFNEGQVTELSIALPVVGSLPPVFKTRIEFISARELTDALAAGISSSVSGERSYRLPSASNATLSLQAFINSAATYTMNVGGRTVTLDQTRDNTVKLNRVDVDDVAVTREDGTIYNVRGTYELYFGGTRVVGPAATNTGVDMLPGEYEIVIKYTTAEGAQTQRQTIQL